MIREYEDHSSAQVINLDLGSYFADVGPESEAVNSLLLEALDFFPVHVMNLSTDDLHMWPTLAREERAETVVISTNLVPPSNSQGKLRKYAIQEIPLGDEVIKIGFLGLADPRKVKPNSGFQALDPEEAVAQVKAEVLEQADFLVVIGDMGFELTETLAQQHPEIYVILQLQRQYMLPRPRQVNNAVLLSSVERGRYLGRLELGFDSEGELTSYEPEFIQLDASVPESPAMLEKVSKVRE